MHSKKKDAWHEDFLSNFWRKKKKKKKRKKEILRHEPGKAEEVKG
jgi:hypothetical protein